MTNLREVILEILLEINEEGEYSHIAIRRALDKLQYLPRQERAFLTRVCEGTTEYRLQIDYIINQFSSVKVEKMKPVIRNILRSAVYQMRWMDSVPDSAVCNEAVKLAQKKGFYNLKGFVNGVLRNIMRSKNQLKFPGKEQLPEYLSVVYSMPRWLVERWLEQYGAEVTEKMLADFLKERPTTVRCRQYMINQEVAIRSMEEQGVHVERAPYLDYAYYISGYDYLPAVESFFLGRIQPQDVSSMLVGEAADPEEGSYCIDLCAAPGGKSLHLADKLKGTGRVEARDVSQYKVELIRENIERSGLENIYARRKDALVMDPADQEVADLVLADVPCSGYGVIGHKTDIKYKMTPQKEADLVMLQRRILHNAAQCVRPGGTLIYSTCTVNPRENEENVRWFLENYPYQAESLDSRLPQELHSETTAQGWLQLIPGVHKCDGFFLARLKRKKDE